MGRAMCHSDTIDVPFVDYEISKDSFGLMVVVIDILCVMVILASITIIGRRQQEFIDAFKDDTIQMDDYTIKVKQLPKDAEFGGD